MLSIWIVSICEVGKMAKQQESQAVAQETATESEKEIKAYANKEAFIAELQEQAKGLYISESEKAEKDYSISSTLANDVLVKLLKSENVTVVTVNKVKATIRSTLYNKFVYDVMSAIYKIDFAEVRKEISKNFGMLVVFNRFIGLHLKDRATSFISRL